MLWVFFRLVWVFFQLVGFLPAFMGFLPAPLIWVFFRLVGFLPACGRSSIQWGTCDLWVKQVEPHRVVCRNVPLRLFISIC